MLFTSPKPENEPSQSHARSQPPTLTPPRMLDAKRKRNRTPPDADPLPLPLADTTTREKHAPTPAALPLKPEAPPKADKHKPVLYRWGGPHASTQDTAEYWQRISNAVANERVQGWMLARERRRAGFWLHTSAPNRNRGAAIARMLT
jgi:hypothetical protein